MKLILFIILIGTFCSVAQTIPPKREVRAVWITSIYNLDWPSSRWASTQAQKNELISILNDLQDTGINTVFLQIRPECDALYQSDYEPWSKWLTGYQGTPPSPFYDPLQFACEEAKKRNMELHAWFNPYRAQSSASSVVDPSHVTVQHPDWVIQISDFKFLNPGLPQVREYVAKVVTDVVNRYEIDGVHFDDYFYPYPPNNITNEDSATFANYSRGFTNLGDWRRDNVNLLVETIYDSVNYYKPWVKFGISPFGIWKNNTPPGVVGTSSYHDIYCDPVAWLNGQYIDYVNPQLYWQIGGPQDYSLLMPWWASVSNNRHIYTGHALYKMSTYHNWPSVYIADQIRLNRLETDVHGSVFYRTDHIILNTKGIADTLGDNFFNYPALLPTMSWKDSIPPNSPQTLTASVMQQGIMLQWELPDISSDGDTAKWFVVYRSLLQDSINIENPQYIKSIVKGNIVEYLDNTGALYESYKFQITSLDKLQNESLPSNPVTITYTGIDLLSSLFPDEFLLHQNFPNPFNATTKIKYDLANESFVELKIYNQIGALIATLISESQRPGHYQIQWDASNFSSGTYYYYIQAGSYKEVRKMILVK